MAPLLSHGRIFCLVEADSAADAATVHREAHGLVADEIYAVGEHSWPQRPMKGECQTQPEQKETRMRKTPITATTILALALAAAPVAAQDAETDGLDDVRALTATYSWLPNALDDGFVPFSLEGTDVPTCFENEAGGMGVHYVRNVDGVADALDPEAMVYEIADDGGLRLVAVEYVVPQELVEDEDGEVLELPELHGQHFQKHSTLPLYTLHAWIWDENPDGMFADFNPAVAACPAI